MKRHRVQTTYILISSQLRLNLSSLKSSPHATTVARRFSTKLRVQRATISSSLVICNGKSVVVCTFVSTVGSGRHVVAVLADFVGMKALHEYRKSLSSAANCLRRRIGGVAKKARIQLRGRIAHKVFHQRGYEFPRTKDCRDCALQSDVLNIVFFYLPLTKLMQLKTISKEWANAVRRCLTSTEWLSKDITYTPYVYIPCEVKQEVQAVTHFVNNSTMHVANLNAHEMRALVHAQKRINLPHKAIFETSMEFDDAYDVRAVLHDLQVTTKIGVNRQSDTTTVCSICLEVEKHGVFTNLTQLLNCQAFKLDKWNKDQPLFRLLHHLKLVTYVGEVPFVLHNDRNFLNDGFQSAYELPDTSVGDMLCDPGYTIRRFNGELCKKW